MSETRTRGMGWFLWLQFSCRPWLCPARRTRDADRVGFLLRPKRVDWLAERMGRVPSSTGGCDADDLPPHKGEGAPASRLSTNARMKVAGDRPIVILDLPSRECLP